MTGSEFVERLDFLLKEKNLKRTALHDLGIPPQTISNWKKRGNMPTLDIAERIADFFDLSIDALINRPQKENKKISAIAEKYKSLSARDKNAVDALIASLLSSSDSADSAADKELNAQTYASRNKADTISGKPGENENYFFS